MGQEGEVREGERNINHSFVLSSNPLLCLPYILRKWRDWNQPRGLEVKEAGFRMANGMFKAQPQQLEK